MILYAKKRHINVLRICSCKTLPGVLTGARIICSGDAVLSRTGGHSCGGVVTLSRNKGADLTGDC